MNARTKTNVNDSAKMSVLDGIYATLPALECRQLCSVSCGPIVVSRLEAKRLNGRHPIRTRPMPTRIESGQSLGVGKLVETDACCNCPMLEAGQCSVYDIRPAICRLWGLVPSMPCPFGCVPERQLSEREGFEFMEKVFRLGF